MVAQHYDSARPPHDEPGGSTLPSPSLQPRSQENEGGVDKERIEPAVLHMVSVLFSEDGLELLAQLCRRAIDKQFSLFSPEGETCHVAVITFHGIPDLVTMPGWKWGQETTLKLLQVMEALTIFVRFRRAGHTEIHIPLGPRVLSYTQILANLETCAYRNKKTRQLVKRVRKQLLHAEVPRTEMPASPSLKERPELGLLVHDLLAVLQEEGIPAAKQKRIALWYSTELVRRGLRDFLGDSPSQDNHHQQSISTPTRLLPDDSDNQTKITKHLPHRNAAHCTSNLWEPDDSLTAQSPSSRSTATEQAILTSAIPVQDISLAFQQDDSLKAESSFAAPVVPTDPSPTGDTTHKNAHNGRDFSENRPYRGQPGDSESHPTTLPLSLPAIQAQPQGEHSPQESPASPLPVSPQQAIYSENRPLSEPGIAQNQAILAQTASESPIVRPSNPEKGDSLPPSRIESLILQKDSLRDGFDLEETPATPQTVSESSWTGGEAALVAEALTYLRLLDGEEYATSTYLETHQGKRLLGGYKNKLRRSPALARTSIINTLMQLYFHETTKHKPLRFPGKWFHQSFNRYADTQQPMEISGEIASWVASSYTIEEIAGALERERRRQEWDWGKPLYQPFASCVEKYHRLQLEDVPADTVENDGQEQAGEQFQSSLVEEEDREGVAMMSGGIGGQEGEESDVQQNTLEEPAHVNVEDASVGWYTANNIDMRWWYERLCGETSLTAKYIIEVWPTQYGRYVLVATPASADTGTALVWGSGREILVFLTERRASAQNERRSSSKR